MKKLLFVIFALFLCANAPLVAQEKFNQNIAPDVMMTDIYGTEYNLYDILSSGKSVIIDFFATWCSPCWDYHQEGHLQTIWETYGPEGTDEVYVFFVESDIGTTYEDLTMETPASYGNYLDGITYPVLEDNKLANLFEIFHYPTVFYICPDKRVAEVGQLSPSQVATLLTNSCPAPTVEDNLEILYYTNDLSPACNEQVVYPTIMVQNIGTNMVKEISSQLYLNGQPQGDPVEWDAWLETYETLELPFGPFDLDWTTEFTIEILEVNGALDVLPDGNILSATKSWPITPWHEVTLELTTDDYGSETHWELWDENGFQLLAGDYYESNTTYSEEISLITEGCYELKIFDRFGDGMCCNYTEGGYRLLDSNGAILVAGGRFLEEESSSFEYDPNVVAMDKEIQDFALEIFPNPTTDHLQIILPEQLQESSLKITDATGKTYLQLTEQSRQQLIDVSEFPQGLFFVNLSNHNTSLTKSFVIAR